MTTNTTTSTTVSGVPNDDATIERNELSQELVSLQSVDPTLGTASTATGVATTVNDDEIADPTAEEFQIADQDEIQTTATSQGTVIDNPDDIDTATYTSVDVDATPETQAVAAIGNLPEEALVSSQMEELLEGIENGETPTWALPAVATVEAELAARGLSRSSVGQAALSNAIIEAALPIATSNAQAVQASFSQNVANQQEVNITNATILNQQLLSDAAAANASLQFNATSENQTAEFMANLTTSVDLANAASTDAMVQFNSNATDAMAQYNSQLQFNSDQFNAENATVISQSNLAWRRQANSETTAAANEANMQNAQNAYNLQSSATEALWQEMRDNASWTFTAAQNDNQIAAALMEASLSASTQLEIAELEYEQAAYASIGGAATNIFGDIASSAASSIFSGWFS